MMSPHVTLIVKLTNACNMRCHYCFIEPSVLHKKMQPETARLVIRSFLDSNYFQSVDFVWHGGEPLLRGRKFFEMLVREQKSRPTRVSYTNSIQTNATELSDGMVDFLTEHQFQIGLSLDGPTTLTDEARRMRSKVDRRSAYEVTVDAAKRLQQRGRSAGAIVVVNRNNVNEPEAIYSDFSQRGIYMKIIPLTRSGLAATVYGDGLEVNAEEYGGFLIRMFDLWFDDPKRAIKIDPFAQHISRILGVNVAHSCFFTRSCHHHFLGISPDGEVFPCGMFQGEPSFKYGDIHEMDMASVGDAALFKALDEREEKVLNQCGECAFLDLCYSGCMFHSLKDSKVMDEKDYFCASYRMYFEHALRRLHADLSRATQLAVTALAQGPALRTSARRTVSSSE